MIIMFLILLFTAGIFIATFDFMEELYSALGRIVMAYVESFRGVDVTERGALWERVRMLLGITVNMGTNRAVKAFILLSVFCSLSAMTLLSARISVELACICSIIGFFSPYAFLRIRMERIRIKSSLEGEILLAELTENYKINYYNMKEGIDRTAMSIEDAKDSKRLLQNLSMGLQRAGSERSISRLLDEFALSINTGWAGSLKNLMYFSLVHGIRVDEGLEELTHTIRKAREVREFARRENSESKMMLKYLVPVSYGLTVIGGVYFFGLGWEKFMNYQFETEVGMTWITASCIVYAISYMVNLYLSESKLDL